MFSSKVTSKRLFHNTREEKFTCLRTTFTLGIEVKLFRAVFCIWITYRSWTSAHSFILSFHSSFLFFKSLMLGEQSKWKDQSKVRLLDDPRWSFQLYPSIKFRGYEIFPLHSDEATIFFFKKGVRKYLFTLKVESFVSLTSITIIWNVLGHLIYPTLFFKMTGNLVFHF